MTYNRVEPHKVENLEFLQEQVSALRELNRKLVQRLSELVPNDPLVLAAKPAEKKEK